MSSLSLLCSHIGEIILILGIFALLLFARKALSKFVDAMRIGIHEFQKASREITEEIQETVYGEHSDGLTQEARIFLMAMGLLLTAITLSIALHELAR